MINRQHHKYCCLYCQAKINLPAHKVNLSQWIAEFSDDDYRKVSKNHIAAGFSVLVNGTKRLVFVEKFLHTTLIVAHYNLEISEKHYIKLIASTDMYLFGLISLVLRPVIWEMKINQKDEQSSILEAEIIFGHTNVFMAILAKLSKFVVRGHWNKEVPRFAELIYQRFKHSIS